MLKSSLGLLLNIFKSEFICDRSLLPNLDLLKLKDQITFYDSMIRTSLRRLLNSTCTRFDKRVLAPALVLSMDCRVTGVGSNIAHF